jgi:hypothetical protein
VQESSTIRFPFAELGEVLSRIDGDTLDKDVYRDLGVLITRNVIPHTTMEAWIRAWKTFQSSTLAEGRKLDPYNQVVLHEPVPDELQRIHRHPVLLDFMAQLYPDLGLYLQRFVIKDLHNRDPVFLHQDYGYNLGWPEKTSLIVPLGAMNAENGGLVFYPGTHRLGYLGDAGELDPSVLAPDWPSVAPSLAPGDIALMHDCTWHSSPPRVSDVERILVQITYQPADDPSTTVLLRGSRRNPIVLDGIDRKRLFRRSRASRLRELQSQVNSASG